MRASPPAAMAAAALEEQQDAASMGEGSDSELCRAEAEQEAVFFMICFIAIYPI